jgi:hypothetical protein
MGKLTDEQWRALRILARSPNGCTEALMLAYHFTIDMLTELAVDGLLTAHQEHVVGRPEMVVRMQITPAGRREIGEWRDSAVRATQRYKRRRAWPNASSRAGSRAPYLRSQIHHHKCLAADSNISGVYSHSYVAPAAHDRAPINMPAESSCGVL